MANKTSIEWTDFNWNFLRGCSRVSPGCGGPHNEGGCYAEAIAARFSGPGMAYEGLAKMVNGKPRWTGEVSFYEDILLEPLKWRKPRRVFVNSMSDLFHEKVTDEMLDKAFAVMAYSFQHTFQILTKRQDRMLSYLSHPDRFADINDVRLPVTLRNRIVNKPGVGVVTQTGFDWPLPNVWLGVSVEDQKTADERIPDLLNTPAALRWLSIEPLLGPINLIDMPLCDGAWWNALTGQDHLTDGRKIVHQGVPVQHNKIDWVVVGGESGPGARPCDIAWIRSIVDQCKAADVPVFVKQLGANFVDAENGIGGYQTKPPEEYGPLTRRLKSPKGGVPSEWPEDLRVREYPISERSAAAA